MKQSMLLHSVYFYFKEGTSQEVIDEQRERIFELNNKIDHVQLTFAGAPYGIDRDVVDNAYGMSLHMLFQDEESMNTYQQHELHQKFLSDFKPHWTHVKVFDTSV